MFKSIKKVYFNFKQNKINKEFNKEGCTDKVLEKQIELNKKRHENDIHDPSEVMYSDGVREFVQ